ncbi:WD40/YVTN/BNR-like repeat-containing protein [Methyloprofundus sp.]|uniref:WD40/YVTN/BNR-like repeat-containing protein n=1 Tax=Methyloprofundus sp. TaxID=2020875 RepID=UPI003D13B0CA
MQDLGAKLYGHEMHYKNYGYNTTHFAKSYDSGDSWEVIDVAPYVLSDLVINRHNNQQLLMAYGEGVLRSENGGLDWVLSNTGVKKIGGDLSVIEGQNNVDVMYIADRWNGFHHKTTDGGLLWQAYRTNSSVTGTCIKFIINPVNSHELICQTRSGLFRSVDSGENWEILPVEDGLEAIIYANDGQTLYAYFHPPGVLRKSIDNGLSWKNIRNIINESGQGLDFVGLPQIDPRNPNIIYSLAYFDGARNGAQGGFTELYKSINGGDNWKLLVSEAIDGEARLIMHPQNPDLLIYSIGQKSFWRSENGGESWLKTLQQLTHADEDIAPEIEFDPVNLQGLYWLKEGQVQYSADRGVTWLVVNNGLEEAGNGSLISASGDMFFSSHKGIFKLSRKTKTSFSAVSDCLFAWAEKNYPDLFAPGASSTQQWGGYVYRYFKQSNIYLGFFYQQEVHIKQADSSSKIGVVGSVAFYQELSGCY